MDIYDLIDKLETELAELKAREEDSPEQYQREKELEITIEVIKEYTEDEL
jgi:hypothetical protein